MLKNRLAFAVFLLAPALLPCAPTQAQNGFVNFEHPHVSPLTLTPDGATLLAVNTADNRLEFFDVTGPSPVWTGSVGVGLDPVSVRCRSQTEAWVVNHLSDSISIVDLPTRRVRATLRTGDEPTDVVFAGSPARAFVTLSLPRQVAVYEPDALAAAPSLISIAGAEPRMLAASPDGTHVYAAIFASGNTTTCIPKEAVANTSGPYSGVSPPKNWGNSFNPPLNPANPVGPLVAHIVRRNAAGQWMDDNNRNWSSFVSWNLADNDVAVIDAQSLAVGYAKGMMTNVMGVAVKPSGEVTPFGTEATNEIRFEPRIKATFIRVMMGLFNPATPATTQVIDLNPHLTYTVRTIPQAQRSISVGDPRGMIWNASGDRAYVAGMGSNNVAVVSPTGARLATISVGQGPTGLALSGDGSRLYVLNKFDSTISVVSTSANAETARIAFHDPTPAVIRTGRPFLYNTHTTSGLGQTSCASCHIDGRSDFLAWDLGDPSGPMKPFNQVCSTPNCDPWHPMKGPMITQTLQGIIGNEPFHWRGDREDFPAFAHAFVGLQGADAEPSPIEMQAFTDFIATIQYPPNPNRNIDNTMPSSVNTTTGTGNPNTGLSHYNSLGSLFGAACRNCHGPIPGVGTNGRIDQANLALFPQPIKIAQLRGLNERTGWSKASQQAIRGFGYNHNSEFDSIWSLLGVGFTFASGSTGATQKRDIEAFLMCFDTGTHAGVGQQVTFTGPDNTDPALVSRLNTFVALANTGQLGLVARDRNPQTGRERGWFYAGGNVFQGDRQGTTASPASLRLAAATGSEVTFTLTPSGTQRRIGIDRDADGWPDGDELAVCANPADPSNFPGGRGCLDVNADLAITIQDLFDFLTAWFSAQPTADFNRDQGVTLQDLFDYLTAYFAGCAGS